MGGGVGQRDDRRTRHHRLPDLRLGEIEDAVDQSFLVRLYVPALVRDVDELANLLFSVGRGVFG